MKQFTEKQLKSLEKQVSDLAFKLEKVCLKHKITDKRDELKDWYDWDNFETQEAIVNELGNLDVSLSNLAFYIQQIANK